MDPAGIHDNTSLVKWLQTRPQTDAVILATRAALRVFPLIVTNLDEPWNKEAGLTALPILRVLLISCVTAKMASAAVASTGDSARAAAAAVGDVELRTIRAVAAARGYPDSDKAITAASSAIRAANFASVDTANSIDAATLAAAFGQGIEAFKKEEFENLSSQVSTAGRAAWLEIQGDSHHLDNDRDLMSLSLWSEAEPQWFTEENWKSQRGFEREQNLWIFWLRWWDGVVSGNQLDWDLQCQVALIPDSVWDAGPAAVADAIRQIEEKRKRGLIVVETAVSFEERLGLVRLQADSMLFLVDAEWDAVRSRNDVPELEQPAHEQRKKLISRLRDLILELQAIAAGNSDVRAGTELVRVEEKLPAIVEAAAELADATKNVQPSAGILAIATSTKVLTDSGMPGHIASGIAVSDWIWGKLRELFPPRPKK
jgi:hypothetical protein